MHLLTREPPKHEAKTDKTEGSKRQWDSNRYRLKNTTFNNRY